MVRRFRRRQPEGEAAWRLISWPARGCRRRFRRGPADAKAGRPTPGLSQRGALVGLVFGQRLARRCACSQRARGLRLTPWRMILAEGLHEMPDSEGLSCEPNDPMLRVIACSGAPSCPEAHADTRALAAALAPHLAADARLHVSGCAKGCAHPGPAPLTLVATAHGFDLVHDGSARDTPAVRGLDRNSIMADPPAARELALMLHVYETDGAAIYQQSFATIRAEADLARFTRRRGAGGGADDPCRGHGRPGATYPLHPGHGAARARGAAGRRADPVRCAHGVGRASRARGCRPTMP